MVRNRIAPSIVAAFALAAPLALVSGCGEDAAKDKPKAAISEAKPESAETVKSPAPKPAEAASSAPSPTESRAAGAVAEAAAKPGTLAILPETSKLEFIGSKLAGDSHKGGFKGIAGLVELVEGKPEVKGIVFDVDTNSIWSDDEKLTTHLKNKDFFEVATYPAAKFATTEIRPGGEKGASHTLVGNLTLHGVTKSITIPATVKVEGDTVSLVSEFALNKDDFGMKFGLGMIRPEVVVKFDIKAGKKG